MTPRTHIAILGVFVADTAYRADRAPRMGETILGNSFALGPGGKGSNQAVAAAQAGAEVHFISKIGRDTFGDLALATWAEAGVTPAVAQMSDSYTGAAYVFIEESSGDNAIIICPGVGGTLSPDDVDARSDLIAQAGVFITQLEQPMEAAMRGLEIARAGGATTILNPAPAAPISPAMLALCDYVTPNESEVEAITGLPVGSLAEAERAAGALLGSGVGAAIITLGADGVLYRDADQMFHTAAIVAGAVAETTGAGDAFNGGFAAALVAGADARQAVRFGCAAAGISVTRPGTAASMPTRAEIEDLLGRDR